MGYTGHVYLLLIIAALTQAKEFVEPGYIYNVKERNYVVRRNGLAAIRRGSDETPTLMRLGLDDHDATRGLAIEIVDRNEYDNTILTFDVEGGMNGKRILFYPWHGGSNQRYQITPTLVDEGFSIMIGSDCVTVTDHGELVKSPCLSLVGRRDPAQLFVWVTLEEYDMGGPDAYDPSYGGHNSIYKKYGYVPGEMLRRNSLNPGNIPFGDEDDPILGEHANPHPFSQNGKGFGRDGMGSFNWDWRMKAACPKAMSKCVRSSRSRG
jgi:hypothetical protein